MFQIGSGEARFLPVLRQASGSNRTCASTFFSVGNMDAFLVVHLVGRHGVHFLHLTSSLQRVLSNDFNVFLVLLRDLGRPYACVLVLWQRAFRRLRRFTNFEIAFHCEVSDRVVPFFRFHHRFVGVLLNRGLAYSAPRRRGDHRYASWGGSYFRVLFFLYFLFTCRWFLFFCLFLKAAGFLRALLDRFLRPFHLFRYFGGAERGLFRVQGSLTSRFRVAAFMTQPFAASTYLILQVRGRTWPRHGSRRYHCANAPSDCQGALVGTFFSGRQCLFQSLPSNGLLLAI